MESWLLLLVIAIVVVVVLRNLPKKQGIQVTEEPPWPFFAKRALSQREQVLYHRLVNALPEHIVLAQVGLSRILGVKKGNNFQSWYNRINRMSADFVVCTKDARVAAVIELDDSSHQQADRRAADAKKDKALGSAGIQVIRWQATSLPDAETIKAMFTPVQFTPSNTLPDAAGGSMKTTSSRGIPRPGTGPPEA